jgi:hypothetical protein
MKRSGIAKSVFQIYGIDAAGNITVRASSSAAKLFQKPQGFWSYDAPDAASLSQAVHQATKNSGRNRPEPFLWSTAAMFTVWSSDYGHDPGSVSHGCDGILRLYTRALQQRRTHIDGSQSRSGS